MRKDEPTAVYFEPEDGYWPLLLAVSVVVAMLTWIASSFLAGLFIGFSIFRGRWLCRASLGR